MSPDTTRKRRNPSEDVQAIYAGLRAAGLEHPVEDLAAELGKGRTTVIRVIWGELKSGPIAREVANRLGTSPDLLWPQLYHRAS